MNPDTTVATRPLRPFLFSLLSVVIGLIAALGAVAFRALIGLVHNVMFLGQWSINYDANLHTPASPWGIGVILVPVIGAMVVAFVVKNFAPEAKGHGVPEVMNAIYYNRGRIRPVVALIKSLASAISIGTGGSVGREGPIVQIGSSMGSTAGQLLRVPAWQRITLIACGAGAGIAATFNTPIGGMLFVLETMMHEVSVRTIVPVAIATATATYFGRIFFGPHPSFVIPELQTPHFHTTNPALLLAFVALGLLMGVISALFIRSIYSTEDFFDRVIGGSYYRKHMLGMFGVGLMLYALMMTTGNYYVGGVGYATVQDILSGVSMPLTLLVVLFVLKLLATSLTLGSGASGGIFSPALFLGATLGAAFGLVVNWLFPSLPFNVPAFALAGMAGMVGGSTGAAVAAIVLIFEMTLDYNVIVPMTITVAISYGLRRVLCRESIYTMKLTRRGHYLPQALRTGPQFMRRAKEICRTEFKPLPSTMTLGELAELIAGESPVRYFLVEENGKIIGSVHRSVALQSLRPDRKRVPLNDVVDRRFIIVPEAASLYEVIDQLHAHGVSLALVTGANGAVIGVISKERLADAAIASAELFRD